MWSKGLSGLLGSKTPSAIRKVLLSTKVREARRKEMIDKFLRVDHAGEFGADKIYAGQLAVLGPKGTGSLPFVPSSGRKVPAEETGALIQHMWDQEKEHLAAFERLIPKHRARPTALLPIWNIAGYALGAGSALLGREAAMACTVAVEAVITEHYNDQIRALVAIKDELSEDEREILDVITKCRDEEQEHHDTGLEQEAEKAFGYPVLSAVITAGCKIAILASEKV